MDDYDILLFLDIGLWVCVAGSWYSSKRITFNCHTWTRFTPHISIFHCCSWKISDISFCLLTFFLFLLVVTDVELKRAKESTKAAILMNLESRVCSLSLYIYIDMLYHTAHINRLQFSHERVCILSYFFRGPYFIVCFGLLADDCIRRYREAGFDVWREVGNFLMGLFSFSLIQCVLAQCLNLSISFYIILVVWNC